MTLELFSGRDIYRQRVRILLVDDTQPYLEALCAALSEMGHIVCSAESGEDALKLLDEKIDLLITDLMMPGMNGAALIARARVQPGLGSLPAILMTGSSRAEAERALLAENVDATIAEKAPMAGHLATVLVQAARAAPAKKKKSPKLPRRRKTPYTDG